VNYKTIVLKFSGEALLDDKGIISYNKLQQFVLEIKSITLLGIKVLLVVGGGNILRGETAQSLNITRYKLDNMGMLATIINAIAFEDCLQKNNVNSVVLSALQADKVCEFYTADKALKYLQEGKVVISAAGIGNPYFSTDTSAVLRALEIGANAVLKGTQVDGVYNKDPKKYTDAVLYDKISYDDFIDQKLGVMDASAVFLAQKQKIPVIIFNLHKKGNLKEIILNTARTSTIT
jgi:uridylate kinase